MSSPRNKLAEALATRIRICAAQHSSAERLPLSETEARRRIEEQKLRLEALGYDVRTPAPTAEDLLANERGKRLLQLPGRNEPCPQSFEIRPLQRVENSSQPRAVSACPETNVSGGTQ